MHLAGSSEGGLEYGLRVGKPLKEAEGERNGSGAERVLLNSVAFGDGELSSYYCTTLRHGPLTALSIFQELEGMHSEIWGKLPENDNICRLFRVILRHGVQH